jgi:hypothetical protein
MLADVADASNQARFGVRGRQMDLVARNKMRVTIINFLESDPHGLADSLNAEEYLGGLLDLDSPVKDWTEDDEAKIIEFARSIIAKVVTSVMFPKSQEVPHDMPKFLRDRIRWVELIKGAGDSSEADIWVQDEDWDAAGETLSKRVEYWDEGDELPVYSLVIRILNGASSSEDESVTSYEEARRRW